MEDDPNESFCNEDAVDAIFNEGEQITPQEGMIFDDQEAMFQFYKEYARKIGFPMRKRSTRNNVEGIARSVTFACSKSGEHESRTQNQAKPKGTVKSGCNSYITGRRRVSDNKWFISVVRVEHNHECKPDDARFMKCYRKVSGSLRRQVDLNDRAGITIKKNFNAAVLGCGGYENTGCTLKDVRNAINEIRNARLGDGDAMSIMKYFSKMTVENSGFYFAVKSDDEDNLEHVFWVDGMSREAYKEFGEVVSFDTTYLVNKYDMPFAPFVGVNHHGQTILLGCGLVSNETTETFVWLFSKWLECMSGKAPKAIVTDQGRAMQNSIKIVFPQARHRWCIWHVMKKLPDKFGAHKKFSDISFDMRAVVYDSQFPEEFEQLWDWMLNEYDLGDNKWLHDLYEEREMWVPCYLNNIFWAGMSSTQRSEGVNAFFDGYINAKTALKQFVEQYEFALRDKVEKEKEADAITSLKSIPFVTEYPMERQVRKFYTNSKFKEFQVQLLKMMYCNFIKIEVTPNGTIYNVHQDVWIEEDMYRFYKKMTYFVTYNSQDCDVHCSCQMFAFRGIQCCHALSVLSNNSVRKLPDKYILRWWRKDVKRCHTKVKVGFSCWKNDDASIEYYDLCNKFGELADLVAGTNQYREVDDWVSCKKKEVEETFAKAKENDKLKGKQIEENVSEAVDEDADDMTVNDPLHRPRRGRTCKKVPQPNKKRSKKKDGWPDDMHASQIDCVLQTQKNSQSIGHRQQHGIVHQEQHGIMHQSFANWYGGGSFTDWMLNGCP